MSTGFRSCPVLFPVLPNLRAVADGCGAAVTDDRRAEKDRIFKQFFFLCIRGQVGEKREKILILAGGVDQRLQSAESTDDALKLAPTQALFF